jgi:hypothetical protein
MLALCIKVPLADAHEIEAQLHQHVVVFSRSKASAFGGQSSVSLIVPLSQIAAAVIVALYRERQKSRRAVELSFKGIKIKGASDKLLTQILDSAKEMSSIEDKSGAA